MQDKGYTTRELWIPDSAGGIYGKLYLPERAERPRLAVYAHEIGCTHATAQPYAEHLARRGLALFAPDFRGGGEHSRSDGDSLDMSVLTEADDLELVFDAARRWTEVDGEKPVLIGGSQGGLVAAIYAGRHPKRVGALIELYPAFNIPDAMRAAVSSPEEAPERQFFNGWIWMGRRYFRDMWDYDPYGESMRYKGHVLILHGDADDIISIDYSRRAAEKYADAEFHAIRNGKHMFSGDALSEALGYIDGFLEKHGLLPAEVTSDG